MAYVRYAKTLEQVRQSAEAVKALTSTVRSLRAVYETDPAIVAAVIPRPLAPAARPEVVAVVSQLTIHLGGGMEFELGAGTFGVAAHHEGTPGTYQITMPMTNEVAVLSGRDTYGEPKKLAEIELGREGDEVWGRVTRMGMTYLELRGTVAASLGPGKGQEYSYCFKALPSGEEGKAFDVDPLLVRLDWRHKFDSVERVEGEVKLGDSPFDPVADLPVRRLVSLEYRVGSTESGGKVLRSVPGEWLLPYLHQRYDDPMHPGVEVGG